MLGLLIVSCDKDDNTVDMASLSPQDLQMVDLQSRFDAFNELIAGIEVTKNRVSTSKGGDNGVNWLELSWFTSDESDGESYVYLRPEQLGNGCSPDNVSNMYKETYTLIGTNKVNIQVGDTDGQTFDLPASLQSRYTSAFAGESSSIFFADFNDTWKVRFGAIPTVTVND